MALNYPLDRLTAKRQFLEVDAAYRAALDAGGLITPQEIESLKLLRDAAAKLLSQFEN